MEYCTCVKRVVMWGKQYVRWPRKKQSTMATEAGTEQGEQIWRDNQNWLLISSIQFVSLLVE
jgi:hypothetical protein